MTQLAIPSLSYTDFAVSLWQKTGHRLPYAGTIEVTPYCNLKCAHCYIAHCHWEEPVLSYPEMCRLLDEIVQEGCLWLLFSGGEPFLRGDFLDIYTYAKKKGMMVSIFTNGTLITPEIARYLGHWTPRSVEVSLYGATRATHERVTGVPGSFERCLSGVELLLAQGIRVSLKTMIMTLNKHEVWEIKKLARDFGTPFRFDAVLNPGIDGSRRPCQLRLSPEEVVGLDLEDPERAAAWNDSCQVFLNLPVPRDSLFTCGAGVGRFNIDAFGRLQMCTIAREPAYDLRQGSFREGWWTFMAAVVAQKQAAVSPCRSCRYRPVCLICPGWTQLEYDTSEERPVDYLCQIARLRARAFGLERGIAAREAVANEIGLNLPSGQLDNPGSDCC